jgi:alkylated DNA nucleotide flippase Atl1
VEPPGPGLPTPFAEQVLDLVEAIPPGRVLAYGDLAELVGTGGPRQVGRVMALWGGGVPWWRVVRATGHPALGHEREALRRLRQERAPLTADGGRVDMSRGRWAEAASAARSLDSAGLSGTSVEMDR